MAESFRSAADTSGSARHVERAGAVRAFGSMSMSMSMSVSVSVATLRLRLHSTVTE
jgi:hypothetical protein